jgi:hypothetical protein
VVKVSDRAVNVGVVEGAGALRAIVGLPVAEARAHLGGRGKEVVER